MVPAEKTVAILASLDTKQAEVAYLRTLIEREGNRTLVIDLSTRSETDGGAEFPPASVIARIGVPFSELAASPRDRALDLMRQASGDLVEDLYRSGRLSAVLAVGGLQNTLMATGAMQRLPFGIPKVMVSTVACGQRTFGPFVGASDLVMVPSIADLAGRNPITDRVLENAAGMVCGMLRLGGAAIQRQARPFIGATLMGATQDGIMPAVDALRQSGCSVACFHTTGVGGLAMESLAQAGMLTGVLDLCLHEVTSDYFNAGFSVGGADRIQNLLTSRVPAVFAPAGVDFIDLTLADFQSGRLLGDPARRQHVRHNSGIAHVKLFPEEMRAVAERIVTRLNQADSPISVVVPLQGFRSYTKPGEPLHNPAVDFELVDCFREQLKPDIRLIELDCPFEDERFGRCAADELLRLIRHPGPPVRDEREASHS